jgi:uncharacterized protein
VTETRRPLPVPDVLSQPFWEAAADHRLALARCDTCDNLVHPPETPCPQCGSLEATFIFSEVEGSGTIKSWTVVRRSFLPGFDVPFVLVDVELTSQPDLRLIGRLVDGVDAPVRLGAVVRLTFEDLSPEISVPAFELEVDR